MIRLNQAMLSLLTFGMAIHLAAQSSRAKATAVTPQTYVQSFYDWYVPWAEHADWQEVWLQLKSKKQWRFSPELTRALDEDYLAQSKNPDTIVGLDGDPFLNSQDPFFRYVAGAVRKNGDHILVDVHSIRDGKRWPKPDVICELDQFNGRFRFVNFLWPEGGNLMNTLRLLREGRAKSATTMTPKSSASSP